MLFQYQNVVQIHYYNIFYNKIPKDIIYYSLECDKTICYVKKSVVCTKGYLLLIIRLDMNIVEFLTDIQLSEVLKDLQSYTNQRKLFFFLIKKTSTAIKNLKGHIHPIQRFLVMSISSLQLFYKEQEVCSKCLWLSFRVELLNI